MNTSLLLNSNNDQLDPELEAILNLPSPQKEERFIDYVLTSKDISSCPIFGGHNSEFYQLNNLAAVLH